jgi:stearoyl-CoA desaturase (delta-9 desaturase)
MRLACWRTRPCGGWPWPFPRCASFRWLCPCAAGWLLGGGSLRAAVLALPWAGLVGVLLLQHVTWSVSSLCHLLGSRPFATRRRYRATSLWPLAVLSLGESWRNMRHSDPACAQHGVDRGQPDASAGLIRLSSASAG